MGAEAVHRRAFLGYGAASILAGCMSCHDIERISEGDLRHPIGDAHVHLFNGSDLPVQGFMEFVIIPAYLPGLPDVALALIDMAITVMKALSISAAEEQENLLDSGSPTRSGEVSAAAFADRLADRIEAEVQGRGFIGFGERRPRTSLGDSYFMLSLYLEELRAQAVGRAGPMRRRPGSSVDERQIVSQSSRVDRRFLARIAERGSESAGAPQRVAAESPSAGCELAVRASTDIARIPAVIKWAFGMVHSRCRHVRDYLALVDTDETYAAHIVNLLVDYDQWLDDRPASGSNHGQQVEFWTRYARTATPRLEISTFAGYDPLKHAEERLKSLRESDGQSDRSAHFEDLKSWYLADPATANRKVAGFKLYPPMGFNVDSNAGMVVPTMRAGAVVRARWEREGWGVAGLGAELDVALEQFFRFCAQHDAPMMAHGRHGNCASPGTGDYAHPRHWHRRAQTIAGWRVRPLRACIGHYTMGSDFARAMSEILDLNYARRSQIYFDLSYSPQFLAGEGAALLREVGRICETHDREARYVMFGTDWIMLGQEPDAGRYTAAAMEAARADRFWKDHVPALFGGNLARFLGRGAATAEAADSADYSADARGLAPTIGSGGARASRTEFFFGSPGGRLGLSDRSVPIQSSGH